MEEQKHLAQFICAINIPISYLSLEHRKNLICAIDIPISYLPLEHIKKSRISSTQHSFLFSKMFVVATWLNLLILVFKLCFLVTREIFVVWDIYTQ
jgi:hypothetical protein